MKKISLFSLIIFTSTYLSNCSTGKSLNFKDGDIIFQESQSSQCKAVQMATKSRYSHCGIIFTMNGEYYVYEAVQPVTITPFKNWIARGKNNHYVVKRLKNSESILTDENLHKMKNEGAKFYGKDYDLTFQWSDENIYYSKLVWKIYKRALNIEVGNLQKLGDFDLSSDIVKTKLKERYEENIPFDEKVISPESIFECDLLETIANEN